LLGLSNQYDIPRLQQKCESIATKGMVSGVIWYANCLCPGVDFENVSYVWKLSKLYQTPKLREFCVGIIIKHYDVVSKSESFKYLDEEDLAELRKLKQGGK